MLPTMKEGLELDRIDVNGNYEPQNCRWITHQENCQNRRDSINYKGESAKNASKRLGFKPGTVRNRVLKGWNLEDAFSLPKYSRKPK